MKQFFRASISLSALLLGACAAGHDYKAPVFDLPAWWHSTTAKKQAVLPAAPVANVAWWQDFHDVTLNDLVVRALAKNHDLKIAQSRITEARANRQSTVGGLYPQVNLAASAQDNKQVLFGDESIRIKNYRAVFDATWELDLFGGRQRLIEASDAVIHIQQARLRDVTITLIGDVARNYIEWRQLQQQILLTRQTMAAQKNLLTIAKQKYAAGTGSYFEASQAETLYKSTLSMLPEQERQRDAAGFRLSVLLGETPGALNDELGKPKAMPRPTKIPALAEPSTIIRNRPDIVAAEQQLAQATALQAEALTALYPGVSIGGFFGINGASLGQATDTWGVSPQISLPLLDFGRIRGQIKASDARQQQAFHLYQSTVLQAMGDVETSLTNVEKANDRTRLLQEAVKSAAQTMQIANDRYQNGLTNFVDVLDSQQQLYNAQTTLVQSQGDLLLYLISLHKALAVGA